MHSGYHRNEFLQGEFMFSSLIISLTVFLENYFRENKLTFYCPIKRMTIKREKVFSHVNAELGVNLIPLVKGKCHSTLCNSADYCFKNFLFLSEWLKIDLVLFIIFSVSLGFPSASECLDTVHCLVSLGMAKADCKEWHLPSEIFGKYSGYIGLKTIYN